MVRPRISAQPLVSDAPCYALFIVIRWFVTDSFSYPVAAIFHMAWFTMPLHAPLVDEWLLRGIILAHIPLPRVQRSALRGLTAFIQIIGLIHLTIRALGVKRGHCLLFVPPHCVPPPTLTLSYTHNTNLLSAGVIDYCC